MWHTQRSLRFSRSGGRGCGALSGYVASLSPSPPKLTPKLAETITRKNQCLELRYQNRELTRFGEKRAAESLFPPDRRTGTNNRHAYNPRTQREFPAQSGRGERVRIGG